MQVKRFLEQANRQLPNLSKNLFVLFNHWDQVVDEDEDSDNDDGDDAVNEQDPEALKKQHCQKVHEFLEQGLEAKAVLDRTFFVSGKEACKAQENEKKGKQLSAGTYIFRSVVHVQHFTHKPLSFHNDEEFAHLFKAKFSAAILLFLVSCFCLFFYRSMQLSVIVIVSRTHV